MKFTISREALLRPLTLAAGVVERRQTLPILANVLLKVSNDRLMITGTDLEVELVGSIAVETMEQSGKTTVPARKLMEICRSLPDGALLDIHLDEQRLVIRSQRARFTLSTLPAEGFPNIDAGNQETVVTLARQTLKKLIDQTSFAMAQQDVRYYLNGMLVELEPEQINIVATDGHRLAISQTSVNAQISQSRKIILPRKGVLELNRLLNDTDTPITLELSTNYLRAQTGDFIFTSKLIDGKFPDYDRVIPKNNDKEMIAPRLELRQMLARTAILSNEKYRGIKLFLEPDSLKVQADNPEQEEAEETINVRYQGETLSIGFNVGYLLDVLNVIPTPEIKVNLADNSSSALITGINDSETASNAEAPIINSRYVIMPMRL